MSLAGAAEPTPPSFRAIAALMLTPRQIAPGMGQHRIGHTAFRAWMAIVAARRGPAPAGD
jgi:hypothetical protein